MFRPFRALLPLVAPFITEEEEGRVLAIGNAQVEEKVEEEEEEERGGREGMGRGRIVWLQRLDFSLDFSGCSTLTS